MSKLLTFIEAQIPMKNFFFSENLDKSSEGIGLQRWAYPFGKVMPPLRLSYCRRRMKDLILFEYNGPNWQKRLFGKS